VRNWIAFRVLLPLSHQCFARPRGGTAGWYLQMFAHNVLGNWTNPRTGVAWRK
jgi:hypothetical protein